MAETGVIAAPAAALYPPTIEPPERPLSLLRALATYVRNPLRVLSRPVYEDPLVVFEPSPKRTIVWVTRPDLVEQVLLGDTFQKTDVEKRVLGGSLGDGILTSNGAHWRWQRRAMAPLFRHQEILTYLHEMAGAADALAARWRQDGRRVRAVDVDMTDVTFDVIARTMLMGGVPAEAALLKREGSAFLTQSSWELAWALLQLPTWLPHPGTWPMRRASRRMRGAVGDIVSRRRAEGAAGADLLGRLLAARNPETGQAMDDEHVVSNLLTLLEAGHETTARALTWTLYLLARAPEWQDRVRAEVMSVAGSGPIEAAHIDRLAITERVVKEAMRLYPPAPVLVRMPLTDTKLGDVAIRARAQIIVPIYAIHRHRKLWSDPDRFDPDRFLPEAEKAMPRTQYLPFGAGPRICIGMSFALVEAVVLLATFVRAARFDWDGRHLPEPVSRVTLRPKGGMPLMVEPIS
ncbi:MAG: cytochrome P450 [Hyphomicrobiaceae bacterium]